MSCWVRVDPPSWIERLAIFSFGGPSYRLKIQAPMFVEAVILDVYNRFLERGIYLIHRDYVAVLYAVELIHDVSLVVVNDGSLGKLSR